LAAPCTQRSALHFALCSCARAQVSAGPLADSCHRAPAGVRACVDLLRLSLAPFLLVLLLLFLGDALPLLLLDALLRAPLVVLSALDGFLLSPLLLATLLIRAPLALARLFLFFGALRTFGRLALALFVLRSLLLGAPRSFFLRFLARALRRLTLGLLRGFTLLPLLLRALLVRFLGQPRALLFGGVSSLALLALALLLRPLCRFLLLLRTLFGLSFLSLLLDTIRGLPLCFLRRLALLLLLGASRLLCGLLLFGLLLSALRSLLCAPLLFSDFGRFLGPFRSLSLCFLRRLALLLLLGASRLLCGLLLVSLLLGALRGLALRLLALSSSTRCLLLRLLCGLRAFRRLAVKALLLALPCFRFRTSRRLFALSLRLNAAPIVTPPPRSHAHTCGSLRVRTSHLCEHLLFLCGLVGGLLLAGLFGLRAPLVLVALAPRRLLLLLLLLDLRLELALALDLLVFEPARLLLFEALFRGAVLRSCGLGVRRVRIGRGICAAVLLRTCWKR
jgi:hypothetical protein